MMEGNKLLMKNRPVGSPSQSPVLFYGTNRREKNIFCKLTTDSLYDRLPARALTRLGMPGNRPNHFFVVLCLVASILTWDPEKGSHTHPPNRHPHMPPEARPESPEKGVCEKLRFALSFGSSATNI